MKYFLAKSAKIWLRHILADFAKIAFFEGFEGTSKPSKNIAIFLCCFPQENSVFYKVALSDLIKNP